MFSYIPSFPTKSHVRRSKEKDMAFDNLVVGQTLVRAKLGALGLARSSDVRAFVPCSIFEFEKVAVHSLWLHVCESGSFVRSLERVPNGSRHFLHNSGALGLTGTWNRTSQVMIRALVCYSSLGLAQSP